MVQLAHGSVCITFLGHGNSFGIPIFKKKNYELFISPPTAFVITVVSGSPNTVYGYIPNLNSRSMHVSVRSVLYQSVLTGVSGMTQSDRPSSCGPVWLCSVL